MFEVFDACGPDYSAADFFVRKDKLKARWTCIVTTIERFLDEDSNVCFVRFVDRIFVGSI